jgi:glycosyltransferase involved in cell wall biosynthesis
MTTTKNKIAILVSNDLQGDSRVEKIALSLSTKFNEVVVFGLGSSKFQTFIVKNGFGIYRPACAITGNNVRGKIIGKKVPLKLQMYRFIKNRTLPDFLKRYRETEWEKSQPLFNVAKPVVDPDYQWRIDALEHSWRERLIEWAPDAIHANDADTIGIAIRAAETLRATGKKCRVVYDQHEYLPGIFRADPKWREFMLDQEATLITKVDAVTTVSDLMLEDLISRYELKVPSSVVVNSPAADRVPIEPQLGTIRTSLKLSPEVPLHVYVGVLSPKRGLHTAVEALVLAPMQHVAIVSRSKGEYVNMLIERAAFLEVSERLHWLPYVPAEYVSTYISDATSGLTPLLHVPAHEVSLGTKFYEYVFAGLPVISSDIKVQAETIAEFGLGEVFTAEDAEALAQAMERISSTPRDFYAKRHRELEDLWRWETQGTKLLEIYRSIM